MDSGSDGHNDGHGLPDPALTLTLPSIHDGIPIDCRIYLPPSVLRVASTAAATADISATARRWRGHAAIVAHPYAPMGGSYNDPVVRMVAQTLLQSPSEFVVATFNFRGAGRKPQGRTSWTAKPETGDYMTVAGFLCYFCHFLDPYGEKETVRPSGRATQPPTLLFAGYSYGAMVTSLLPPLSTILGFFVRPQRGSPAAEVRLRAARWAAIQNADFAACRERLTMDQWVGAPASPTRGSPSKTRLSMGVRAGSAGDDDGHWRRKSHETSFSPSAASAGHQAGGSLRHMLSSSTSPRRSLSVDRRHMGNGHAHSHSYAHVQAHTPAHTPVHAHIRSNSSNSHDAFIGEERHAGGVAGWMARVRHSNKDDESIDVADSLPTSSSSLAAVTHLSAMRPAYLLISPPVGLATNLATMSFAAFAGGGLFKRKKPMPAAATTPDMAPAVHVPALANSKLESSPAADEAGHNQENDGDKLASHPTLVVFGDSDSLVSARKMRQWTADLAAASAQVSSRLTGPSAAEPKKLFRAREIATAGHLWHEGRTFYVLQEEVAAFAAELDSSSLEGSPSKGG
ncbi:hypothetical protein SEPCBS119000_005523 [Sporothrix epigloea]|uniref:AB hydrolase-1 domain-containing protein n=1 Tax=Sporothrix epigloea TaxID=1892477 RepID=A0ABP0E263_9PEZI